VACVQAGGARQQRQAEKGGTCERRHGCDARLVQIVAALSVCDGPRPLMMALEGFDLVPEHGRPCVAVVVHRPVVDPRAEVGKLVADRGCQRVARERGASQRHGRRGHSSLGEEREAERGRGAADQLVLGRGLENVSRLQRLEVRSRWPGLAGDRSRRSSRRRAGNHSHRRAARRCRPHRDRERKGRDQRE